MLIPQAAEDFSSVMNTVFDYSNPLTFVAIVLMAPLGEELVFRGVALNKLRRTLPMWAAIAISAFLFALAHFNLLQFIYVLPIGFVLGYVGYRYKSVIPTMVLHLVNNLIALKIGDFLPENDTVAVLILVIFMIAGFGGAFAIQKDNLVSKKAQN